MPGTEQDMTSEHAQALNGRAQKPGGAAVRPKPATRAPAKPDTHRFTRNTLEDQLRISLTEAIKNLSTSHPFAEEGRNPEGIHRYRLTLRRLLTLLRIVRQIAPASEAYSFFKTAKWLLEQFNAARAWDVFLTETLPIAAQVFDDNNGMNAVRGTAESFRRQAYGTARATLTDPVTVQFQSDIALWIDRKGWRAGASPAGIGILRSSTKNARRKILERYDRRVRRRGRGFSTLNSPERHKVRLAAKTLLYAGEVLYSPSGRKHRFFERLSHLLRELGAVNDCATTRDLISQLIEREKDMDGRFAAGIIAGWAAAEVRQDADGLRKAWKRFRSAARPWKK